MAKKYVITGGPGCGKTTTLNVLKKDYQAIEEAARDVLIGYKKEGLEVSTFQGDVSQLQADILVLQLKREKEVEKYEGIVFLDRGVPDNIAYFNLTGTKISNDMLRESQKNVRKYKKVFLLEMIPYKQDSVRKEPEEVAKKVHELIKKAYLDLGYEVVSVPFMSVEERVQFIKDKIH
ncbi:MAG: ATP-binding protein [archaeon]